MSRRGSRCGMGLLGAMSALLVVGVQAVLGAVLWTMTASPLTATVGVSTTFTLTATNLDPLLGVKCVVAEVPPAIQPGDVWIVGSSTTAAWVAVRSAQQVTAMIDTGDGSQKLRVGDWVSFAFTGLPIQAGAYAISAVAYSGHDCFTGARALAAPPVIVISEQAVVLPEPDPTPAPTPDPTPTPTPDLAVVFPPAPPLPSAGPVSTPRPAAPASGPAPEDRSPTTSADQPPQRSVPGSVRAAASGTVPPGAEAVATEHPGSLAVGRRGDRGDGELALDLDGLGAIDGLGVWAIPGAAVGGPGLIVILWVAVQAAAAVAWVPAVRRLRGAPLRVAHGRLAHRLTR